jgi:hypothetical protein
VRFVVVAGVVGGQGAAQLVGVAGDRAAVAVEAFRSVEQHDGKLAGVVGGEGAEPVGLVNGDHLLLGAVAELFALDANLDGCAAARANCRGVDGEVGKLWAVATVALPRAELVGVGWLGAVVELVQVMAGHHSVVSSTLVDQAVLVACRAGVDRLLLIGGAAMWASAAGVWCMRGVPLYREARSGSYVVHMWCKPRIQS